MKQPVTSIVKSYSNRGSEVGWTVLACSHAGDLKLHDWRRSAHDPENRVTKVGDIVECQRCDWYADALAKIHAMQPGDLSHSRFRPHDSRGGSEGSIYVYGRKEGSPTGVELLITIDSTPEAMDALSAVRASPLSPTQRR
jgi:hypothetical protein